MSLPLTQICPALQFSVTVSIPKSGQYLPTGQGRQALEFTLLEFGLYVPLGHGVGTVGPSVYAVNFLQYEPLGHGVGLTVP